MLYESTASLAEVHEVAGKQQWDLQSECGKLQASMSIVSDQRFPWDGSSIAALLPDTPLLCLAELHGV